MGVGKPLPEAGGISRRSLIFSRVDSVIKRRRWTVIALTALVAGGGVMAWRQSHRPEKSGKTKVATSFSTDVAPVLQKNCLRCHGPEKHEGDLRLDSMKAMLIGGKTGPALVPGDPGKSLMIKLVRHEDGDRVMPPKGKKLRASGVEALEKWIKAGARWPEQKPMLALEGKKGKIPGDEKKGDAWSDPENPITKLFAGKRLDLWSLKPVADPVPPAVKDSAWPRNPVDAFVLAKLESGGGRPAPEADSRTLARRLYMDLTGLPPSPERMEEFLNDKSPDAYERLVDKLLASPAYGEQAAAFWLDVARYSDSNGFDYDEFRPNAWRFRDYVIRSFNADKPYDQFVREQLAGDEMLNSTPADAADQDRLIATGFLRVGPYDNSAVLFGESDRCRAQVMFDMVETTSAAFMGMNLSCCRCHDHKVDPISQADYYRMKAIFENVQPNDRLLLDPPAALSVILPEAAAIEKIREKLPVIEKQAITRIESEKAAKLPEEDQRLLAADNDSLSPEQAARQQELKQSIHTTPTAAKAAFSQSEKKAYDEVIAEAKEKEKRRSPYTPGFLVTDAGYWSPETHIFEKGDFASLGEVVQPGVLSVLNPNTLPRGKTVRVRTSGRRSALVDWLFRKDNPLTARVMVNRLWQIHFGQGLVATPNDFGFAGARPTHPELLDWLARQFEKEGWSIKKMHRLIVLSATYRQGGGTGPGAAEASGSGGNLWAGRHPRRITAEELRDSMLAVAGKLEICGGGPPRWPELPEEVLASNPGLLIENEEKIRGWYPSPADQLNVRSIFLIQKRSLRVPMLETFDKPESNSSCGRRIVSTVAPQALTLLNSPFAAAASKDFAGRLTRELPENESGQIERAFALTLQRLPDDTERRDSREFVRSHGLAEFCRVLMNLNEFSYVD